MKIPLRYGLIGCGGFGRFCLDAYLQTPSVRCVAVADLSPTLAQAVSVDTGVDWCDSPEDLIAREDIDIIHLATPPFTHSALALAALRAGKHVLCEKPLALTMEDAEEMARAAAEGNRVLAVNLIMRYNPLCHAVKRLVDSGALGAPLYAGLLNSAKDEDLGPAHWFWDRAKSGGIFIEHGVHFFDLFEWWFGPGTVLSAEQLVRPGTDIVEQVRCSVRYGDSTLGTFYHGFHQLRLRDDQRWTIIFEQGTLTMNEWVPTSLELDASLSDAALETVRGILPRAAVETLARYADTERTPRSRHQPRLVDSRVRISADAGLEKKDLYGRMLRDLLEDQIRGVEDASHARLVNEKNGLTSLRYAIEAQAAADRNREPRAPFLSV